MIRKNIPNTITLLNLFFGFVGIIAVFQSRLNIVLISLTASLVLDFLDGFAARLLKAQSEIGTQLDSLSDVVSFGLLPGIMLFSMLSDLCNSNSLLPYVSGLVPMFTALRLAKFNIDPEQAHYFKGLPSPANAIFIASFYWLYNVSVSNPINILFQKLTQQKVFLILLILICCFLLVSNIKLVSFKMKDFSIKNNYLRYIVIFTSVISVAFFGIGGISLSVILYVAISQYKRELIN